ncbi:MAG: hypothetical protein SGILL_006738 [Bacillariaceae sp.]
MSDDDQLFQIHAHLPVPACSGRVDQGNNKPFVLIKNPITERGSVHTTDQTALQRPEWLFPRCPANMDYMKGCTRLIRSYTDSGPAQRLPQDLEKLVYKVYGDEEDFDFVVRLHRNGDAAGDEIKQFCEAHYFRRECPHGIFVVVPRGRFLDCIREPNLCTESQKFFFYREPLDEILMHLLMQEDEVERMLMEHGHNHAHGHGHANEQNEDE